jgi:hypothetical protein
LKTIPFHFAPAALLLTTVFAQSPTDPGRPAAPAGIHLQSLQMLTTDSVYTRQPTVGKDPKEDPKAVGAGSAAEQVLATIRDAEFDFDGTLVALVVEAPANAGGDAKRRTLPAKSVHWDAQQKRWLAVEPNLKVAELSEYAPAASKKTPASTLMQPRMASELLGAKPAPATPAAGEVAVDASARKANPRIVWWLSPANQQVVFATVPHDGKNLAVPWSVLRTRTGTDGLAVSIEAPPNVIADAPVSASPDDAPTAELRHQSYKHFNVAAPKWDRAPEPTEKDKSKDKGKDKGKESGGK